MKICQFNQLYCEIKAKEDPTKDWDKSMPMYRIKKTTEHIDLQHFWRSFYEESSSKIKILKIKKKM